MRRVFYFSGYRMKVYEWHRKQLLGSFVFEPDDNGKAEFEHFLQTAPSLPSQLLVDIIEEDFRRESIPHVNRRDRLALINRLIDRHYRDDKHNHVQFLGRSKEGRRDDEVLLSALTNMELFEPWLGPIKQHQIPLAGIWSLPLILKPLMKVVTKGQPNVLIVTRQIATAQRESFFKDGKLLFSRQAKLDHHDRDDQSPEISAKNLTTGTDQIRHFITNQRIIGFTDPLDVFYLLADREIDAVKSLCADTNLVRYHFVGLNTLFEKFKLLGCEGRGAATLLTYCCSQQSLFFDHYAQKSQKFPFYRFAVDHSIDTVATLGALVMVTAAALLWLNNMDIKQQQKSTEAGTALLERRYNREFSPISQRIDMATLIQATIDHSSRLRLESAQTPQRYFNTLSKVFSQDQFASLSIDEFIWTKYPANEIDQLLIEVLGNNLGDDNDENDDNYQENYGYEDNAESGTQTLQQAVIKLTGKFKRENHSYRDTVRIMGEFISALEQLPEVEKIHVLRTPVDTRPNSRFSDKSGLEQDESTRNDSENFYELLLVLARGQHD